MVDETAGVIVPDGGRKKTGIRHIAPLTERARMILEGIRAERRSGAAVPNVSGLVFTNQDGKPITKGQIGYQVGRAIRLTGVRKFVFHNYRNTALAHWTRQGINVDIACRQRSQLRSDAQAVFRPAATGYCEDVRDYRFENGYTAGYKKKGFRKCLIYYMEKEGARWCRWSSKPVWGP